MSAYGSTIFALSSGQGRSGIAVWRLSGPQAGSIASALVETLPLARQASYRIIKDRDGQRIDDGIVLWFPGPNSATGEDTVEFHLHGSLAVGQRLADELVGLGAVPADPGEFTLRSFRNGKMSLLAVESLGDLLDAETEAQRCQAIAIGDGAADRLIQDWRDKLIGVLSVLEAAIDFPDEEGVPETIAEEARPMLEQLLDDLSVSAGDAEGGKLIREGLNLVILGRPNVGKSSFLNRLVGEERAIVSDLAGTTRDMVQARLSIAGRLVNVIDTAGVRVSPADKVEAEGVRRAQDAAMKADLVIVMRDSQTADGGTIDGVVLSAEPLRVMNKADAGGSALPGEFALSLKTGEGWSDLMAALEDRIQDKARPALFPRERQQAQIMACRQAVQGAFASAELGPELMSEDVRAALAAIDRLGGRETTEAVLGQIFSSFCVGK